MLNPKRRTPKQTSPHNPAQSFQMPSCLAKPWKVATFHLVSEGGWAGFTSSMRKRTCAQAFGASGGN